jgi:hypothetical protein
MTTKAPNEQTPAVSRGGFFGLTCREEIVKRSVLCRPGSDLLFQALRLSTIGAEDFDGRVRDGIGYRLLAIATRSAKNGTVKQTFHKTNLSSLALVFLCVVTEDLDGLQ